MAESGTLDLICPGLLHQRSWSWIGIEPCQGEPFRISRSGLRRFWRRWGLHRYLDVQA